MEQTNALDTTVATCLQKIIPVYCPAGQHRADGATKSAQHRVLNVLDFGVGRAFNANVFSLNACSNVRQQIQAASKWLSKPWTVIDPNADWGKVACASGERAQFVHEAIGELHLHMLSKDSTTLIDTNGMLTEKAFSDNEEEYKEAEKTTIPSWKGTRTWKSPEPKRSNAQSSTWGPKQPVMPPPKTAHDMGLPSPPRPLASKAPPRALAKKTVYERKRDGEHVEEEPQHDSVWPDAQNDGWKDTKWESSSWDEACDSSWKTAPDTTTAVESVTCPCCLGAGQLTSDSITHELRSFKADPTLLMEILKHHGIDESAQHEAFLLATRFPDGYKLLNDIIHNLLKNHDYIKNKSAFVAGACIKMRKELLPKWDK
jgi:hypothetical protein